LGETSDDKEAEKSDDEKKKDDKESEKNNKENEKKTKSDEKDEDDADKKDKEAKEKQKKKEEKDKKDAAKKKKEEGDKARELATEAEKKENKKREKQEKAEKKEDEEKDEIPDTTGRNLEDAKATEDKKTDDAKKTDDKTDDEDSISTDKKDQKDSEIAGKRRLILRPAAANAPVDDSASSSDYVKKYALGTRNRVLTSVGDTSEGVGWMIGNLEKKLLKTLKMVPIALARGTKGQTEYAFPKGFSAKIGQKKSGYNLAGLNSDQESSNLDFARIH
jgi:hypothetical protein